MRHNWLVAVVAGLGTMVVLLGAGVAVDRHVRADRRHTDLVTARRIAGEVTVQNAHRSSACPGRGITCWSTSLSVRSVASTVDASLQVASRLAPRVRCFPHRVGQLDPGTLVDSCVVDVRVGTHVAYADIDPIMTGPLTHEHMVGATVSLNAD